jgi:hypothetical protein
VAFVIRRAGGFHPATRILTAEGTLTREAVFQLNILDDGTAVLLSRVNGDLDRARRLIGKRADVLGYSISGERESEGLAYVHTRSPEVIGEFVELPRTHEVVFDVREEGTRENGIRVTMIGETNGVLREALADVPEE